MRKQRVLVYNSYRSVEDIQDALERDIIGAPVIDKDWGPGVITEIQCFQIWSYDDGWQGEVWAMSVVVWQEHPNHENSKEAWEETADAVLSGM